MLKFEFGWKHWVDGKYKQKRSDKGGGKRRISISRAAAYDECLEIAKKLFFPKGISSEGHEDDMYFALGNYAGVQIEELDGITEFSAAKYKELTGFTLPSLYLLSRSKCSVDDDSSDGGLNESVFGKIRDEQDNEIDSQPSALIGSSLERKAFLDDLQQQVSESADIDAAKEAAKEAEENERLALIQEEIAKAEKEAEDLEQLRRTRELRVPPTPDRALPRVVLSVRHVQLGVVTREFLTTDTMSVVYDWVGSLGTTPKHFSLSIAPMVTIYPDENVTVADKAALFMVEKDSEVPLSRDETEVTFFNGDDKREADETVLDEQDEALMAISDQPPEILLEEDVETTKEGTSVDGYSSLEQRRRDSEAELVSQLPEKFITVSRHNVVKELLEIYQDPQVCEHKLVAFFEEDSGSGDGVLREIYSIFWAEFLTQSCEGSSQFALSITPAMQAQDYVTLGRILTHGFIQCGSFPVQLARASIHQAMFGTVSDECLLDSFVRLLPEKERETLLTGLHGSGSFPVEEIMDILDDFKESTMPTSANLRTLLIKIAKSEFVTKPYLPLLKLREGMGEFWSKLREEELDALYDMCSPTPARVANYLNTFPKDPQEQKVSRWLKRYTRNLDRKMAVHFVRFCTASDVLLPGKSIMVRFENMAEEAMRPTARTCFCSLTVPRNYRSYCQMKDNFDFYLRDPTQWDLSD